MKKPIFIVLLVLVLSLVASGACFAVCADDGDCAIDREYQDGILAIAPTPTPVLDGCRGQQWYQYGRKVEGFAFKCMPTVTVNGYQSTQTYRVIPSTSTPTVTPSPTPTTSPYTIANCDIYSNSNCNLGS